MRKLPIILSAVFLAIQLSRVADFVSHGLNAGPFLGWAFALGIGAGVFVSAYWTRQSVTRQDGEQDKRDRQARNAARLSMVLFVLLDGTFNLAETLRVLADQSLYWYAVVYGVSPTVIAAGLGSLQGRIDRLPVAPRKSRSGNVLDAIARWLERSISAATPAEPAPLPAISQPEPALAEVKPAYFCKVAGCPGNPKTPDGSFGSQSALNAHGAKHKRIAGYAVSFEPIPAEKAKQ